MLAAQVRQLAQAFATTAAESDTPGGIAAAAARQAAGRGPFDHAIMNLPASAPEFTDAFIGLARFGTMRVE